MTSKKEKIEPYLVIIAKGDVPIYESVLSPGTPKVQKEDLIQFIIHAALDCVEQKVWQTTSMYLKNVDKFNDIIISAFVTAGHIKFMLLHDQKTDENAIKSFFSDVHELYIKILMNPFHEKNSTITSKAFDERVKSLGEKYL